MTNPTDRDKLREALTPAELADFIWRSDGAFDPDDIEAADPPPIPNWTAAYLTTIPIEEAPRTNDNPANDLVADYAVLPASSAPPIAIVSGRLVDGYHRLCAARRRGDETVLAYVALSTTPTKEKPA